jgi:phage shock protein C
MYCTKCGVELREDDRYCSRCGGRKAAEAAERGADVPRRLMLDKRNKKIGGICAGVARYLAVDVVVVRVLWLGIAVCTGVGFLAYLVAWIVIPSDQGMEMRDAMWGVPQTR